MSKLNKPIPFTSLHSELQKTLMDDLILKDTLDKKEEKDKVFFSSDYHLDHANIIKYDNRPFKDVAHMNRTIIDNHNSVIKNTDDFYFLGDFSFNKDLKQIEAHLNELNGNLFFIKGNHDHSRTINLYQKYGTYLGELAEITVENQKIILCHYSLRIWNNSHKGSWNLYGHSHHTLFNDPNMLSFDVGINGDGYNYTPLEFKDVQKIISKKEWKSIDHHDGNGR